MWVRPVGGGRCLPRFIQQLFTRCEHSYCRSAVPGPRKMVGNALFEVDTVAQSQQALQNLRYLRLADAGDQAADVLCDVSHTPEPGQQTLYTIRGVAEKIMTDGGRKLRSCPTSF